MQTDDQIFAAQAEDRAAETVTINDIPAGCSCSGGGGDSKLGEENFTNDPFDPNPTLYHPIVSRAFYCPVLGAHGSGSSGAVHPLTAASPSSAPGQGSTFPGFQSLICYEGLHDRFLLEDQLGSIIGELDEQCRRKHEYVYLDYGQPISRPIVFDSAGYSPAVSGPNSFGETTISVSGLPGIDLEGMEVRVSDGTGNYASATIMIRSGSSLVVWDTASPTVASLISSTRSFVIHSCATSWLDGTWEAVDTGTSKLTENDRDLTTINGQGDLTGYKLIANSGNGTVFTVTGHDPADPAHKIFVTPSISGIVAAGDHYHLQKWEPVGGPPVIATQSGYFTAISGGANTTFTVFASAAGGAISNFRPWQVGYYLQPNTKKPSYHKILSVTGNTVTVEGNCAALASIGPANHFRVVAPPCVNGYEGGRVYDPVCEESRYLWAGYRYEWPIVGHRLLNTQQPDYNQPGPDGSASTWDGNALGQYHCWNREYDVLIGNWIGPDPASAPWFNLQLYCGGQPIDNIDKTGLFTLYEGGNSELYGLEYSSFGCSDEKHTAFGRMLDKIFYPIKQAIERIAFNIPRADYVNDVPLAKWFLSDSERAERKLYRSELEAIIKVFRDVRDGMQHSPPTFMCECACYGTAKAWVIAFRSSWFDFVSYNVHICPSFWSFGDEDYQASAVFHELTHIYAGTIDWGYYSGDYRVPDLRDGTGLYEKGGEVQGKLSGHLRENASTYQHFLYWEYLKPDTNWDSRHM